MAKTRFKHAGIGILFLLATFLMTYPLGIHMGTAVNDTEDTLLNTWILSWDVNQIRESNWSHFFDANFFYPQKKVLAYSEHLFSLSLISLPVNWLSNNPILAYNFTLLFAFFMCGWGLYVLAFYFTKDHWAAFAGGIIYAFAPYKFAQFCHIQVVSAWAIPLAFLYLHKFLSRGQWRHLALLILFFLFQVLGNGYFALYLFLFFGTVILFTLIKEKRFKDRRVVIGFFFFTLVVIAGTIPFFYPYVILQKEMGFARDEMFSADLTSYLATGSLNILYGRISAPFLKQEGELFPGLLAVFLGFLGLRALNAFKKRTEGKGASPQAYRWINTLFRLLIFGLLLISVLIVVTGGFQGLVLGIPFSAKTPKGFMAGLLTLVLIRLIFDRDFRKRMKARIPRIREQNLNWYLWIGAASFLFTLGQDIQLYNIEVFPLGPYELLRRFVPGFDGLRVASRFYIFVLLSLALFASWGFKWLSQKLKNKQKLAVRIIIPLLLMAEYLSIPIPLFTVPVGEQIPKVYQWLKNQKADSTVIELPLPKPWVNMARVEAPRVYLSTYHWKRLFNGYSGYSPPVYVEMMNRFSKGTAVDRIKDMQALGIQYLVFHLDQYDPQKESSF